MVTKRQVLANWRDHYCHRRDDKKIGYNTGRGTRSMLLEDAGHIIQREHETNEFVWQQTLAGRQELLLSTIERGKLRFGHVCRHNTLPNIILQGTVDGRRRRGRPRKSWKDNINEWTGQSLSSLLRIVDDRSRWAPIIAHASVGVPPTTPGRHGY